ncbi:MAG: PilZ domain-containing protein [Butyricicoccus sp.]|nr:PilZ domain-containing protein [Butyricicoccus sp.]
MSHRAQKEKKFMILDDTHEPLASATLLSQQGQDRIFELTSTPSCNLEELPAVNVMSINSTEFMAWRGRVERVRDDRLYFHADERIDSRFRRHLRIGMSFRGYIYPIKISGPRLPIISKDISCGGIAFYSSVPLAPEQNYEIALPCTEPPLIVEIEVLRVLSEEKKLYACEFVDLLPQEEAMIQECIFEYDLHHHGA